MPYKLTQAGIARTAENLKCSIPGIYDCLQDILKNDTSDSVKDCKAYADFDKYDLFLIVDQNHPNTQLAQDLTVSDSLSDIRTDNPFLIKFKVWFIFQHADKSAKSNDESWSYLSAQLAKATQGPTGDDDLKLASIYLLPYPKVCNWAIPGACQCLVMHFEERVSQQELEFI